MAGAAAGITAADWMQTRSITRDSGEGNPIMGDHGQRVPVRAYFPIAIALEIIAAAAIPHGPWRTGFQGVLIGAEVNQVWANWEDGYTLFHGPSPAPAPPPPAPCHVLLPPIKLGVP